MKNILITGASSGIGEATAKYLASQGYRLMLVARNKEKLEMLCTELSPYAKFFLYDLNDLCNIETIFRYCKEQAFILDGFVHCAGITGNFPVRSLDWQFVSNMMNLNCTSFVEMAKFSTSRQYANKNTSIVALSSLASVNCYPGTAAYSMSKNSLNVFCKVLAKEVIRRGIRVNTIMPGYVRTPMMEGMEDAVVEEQQPLGYIEPVEVACLIEYLLSDKSRCITGTAIPISAGMNF